jgi:hypothetical protein
VTRSTCPLTAASDRAATCRLRERIPAAQASWAEQESSKRSSPFALGWVGIALPRALVAFVAYRMVTLSLPMIPAPAAIPGLARFERQPPTAAR